MSHRAAPVSRAGGAARQAPVTVEPASAAALISARLLTHLVAAQPTLLAVDGATGAGKTTLADAVAAGLADLPGQVAVVRLDDLVPGWDALAAGVLRARRLLHDLNELGHGEAETWDWHAAAPGRPLRLRLEDHRCLVLDGCGALAAAAQELNRFEVLRVQVTAPEALRLARVRERDDYDWDVAGWQRQHEELRRAWEGEPRYQPDVVVE